jgi:hypothetical protein
MKSDEILIKTFDQVKNDNFDQVKFDQVIVCHFCYWALFLMVKTFSIFLSRVVVLPLVDALVLAGLGHDLDRRTDQVLVLAADKLKRFLANIVRVPASGPVHSSGTLVNALA